MAAGRSAHRVALVVWAIVLAAGIVVAGGWAVAAEAVVVPPPTLQLDPEAVVVPPPTLQLDPDEVEPGGTLRASGQGWGGQCRVDLALGGTVLGSVVPDNGSFSTDVVAPPGTAPGSHRVVATGREFSGDDVGDRCAGRSNARAEAPLRVLAPPQPALELSGTSIAFGRVAVSGQATAQLTATNVGTGGLTITAVALSGADSDAFAVTDDGCTRQPLPAGGSCVLRIVFRPSAAGPARAVLTVDSNDPDGPQRVELSATATPATPPEGAEPALRLSPTRMDFGSVMPGRQAVERLTATNGGTGGLTITAVALSGADSDAFAVTDDGCTQQTLPAGRSCALTVAFAPRDEGQARAELAVTSEDPASPHLVTLAGAGSPVDVAVVDPGDLRGREWAVVALLALVGLVAALALRRRSPRWVHAHVAARPHPHRPVEVAVHARGEDRSHAVRIVARPDTGTQTVDEVVP